MSAADDAVAATMPVQVYLRSLPPEMLFEVDERQRTYGSFVFQKWPASVLGRITSDDLAPDVRQALLFLSAAHRDGRVRQIALEALSDFPGYLTLAIALIRCADWVPEVRQVAQDAVERLLECCHGEEVLALWPLVLRLHARERASPAWFDARIEPWMFRGQSRPWLLRLLGSDNASVRVWAIARSLERGVEPGFDLLDIAMADPSPRIALHALRHAQRRHGEDRIRRLATSGLAAPHPVIRRESLRALSQLDAPLARETLLPRLSDRAAGVRSLAVYLLRDRYAEDPRPQWRGVLDGSDDPRSPGALAALAEHAEPQDCARIRQWLTVSGNVIRSHALRGLLKAGGQLTEAELGGLVTSGGNHLLRQLSRSIRAGDVRLDIGAVVSMLTNQASTASTGINLRCVMQELGHWQRLELLLKLPLASKPVTVWRQEAITEWVRDADTYAPMGPSRRLQLLQLLAHGRDQIPTAQYRIMEDAIKRH